MFLCILQINFGWSLAIVTYYEIVYTVVPRFHIGLSIPSFAAYIPNYLFPFILVPGEDAIEPLETTRFQSLSVLGILCQVASIHKLSKLCTLDMFDD